MGDRLLRIFILVIQVLVIDLLGVFWGGGKRLRTAEVSHVRTPVHQRQGGLRVAWFGIWLPILYLVPLPSIESNQTI